MQIKTYIYIYILRGSKCEPAKSTNHYSSNIEGKYLPYVHDILKRMLQIYCTVQLVVHLIILYIKEENMCLQYYRHSNSIQ